MTEAQAPPPESGPARARRRCALVAIVFVCALVLRLIGLDWGLPYQFHPDESSPVYQAIYFGTGDLNPHNFYKPTLWPYTLFGVYALYYLVGHVAGAFPTLAHFQFHYIVHTEDFWLIARMMSALFAAGTVLLIYKAGALTGRRAAALLAAALLALSARHVIAAHEGTADAAVAFYSTAVLVGSLMMITRGRRTDALLAGLFLGLACATKYNAVLFTPAVIFAHACRIRREGKPLRRIFDARAGIAAAAAIVAFFVACPYALLDWGTFRETAFANVRHAASGWWGLPAEINGWKYYALSTLAAGEGLPVLIAWVAGTCWLFARRRGEDVVVAFWAASYFAFAGAMNLVAHRYLLPALPAIFLVVACLVADVVAGLLRRNRRALAAAVGCALVLVLVGFQARGTAAFLRMSVSRDFRVDAKEELERMIAPPSTILSDYACYAPPLEDMRDGKSAQLAHWMTTKGIEDLGELGLEAPPAGPEYDITYIDYPWGGDDTEIKIRFYDEYAEAGFRYIILADTLLEAALRRAEEPRYAPYARFHDEVRAQAGPAAVFRNAYAPVVKRLGLDVPGRIDVFSVESAKEAP